MKTVLLSAGIGLLVLGFVLIVVSIVLFISGRRRGRTVAQQPARPAASAAAPVSPVAAPPPRPVERPASSPPAPPQEARRGPTPPPGAPRPASPPASARETPELSMPVESEPPQPAAPSAERIAPARAHDSGPVSSSSMPTREEAAPAETVAHPLVDAEATVAASRDAKPRAKWVLVGTFGIAAGKRVELDEVGVYIGRDRTVADVVIEHSHISKRHVWIGLRGNEVMAIDQGSTNGTYLNATSARIREAPLAAGDILILANDIARFQLRPSA